MKINNLFLKRFINLLIFEVKFNILVILLISPILAFLSEIVAHILGFNYISFDIIQNNISDYRVWSVLILAFALFTFLALIEIAASIIVYYKEPKKVCLFKDIIKGSLELVIDSLKSPTIIPITGGLVLFTFFQTTVSSRLRMPSFIKEYITQDNLLLIIYYFLIFIVFCIIIKLVFIYNEIFLNKVKLKDAIKRSFELTKKNFLILFIVISLVNFLTQISGYITSNLIDNIVSYFAYMDVTSYRTIFGLSILRMLIVISRFIRHAITVSIIRAVIYYFYERSTDKIAINSCYNKLQSKNVKIFRNYKIYLVILIAIVSNAIYFNFLISKEVNIYNKTYVTAHRGGGRYGLENSIESIKNGAKMKVEYSEIDVRLTKDNQVILSHDRSLKRIFNKNVKVDELNIDEIESISVNRGGIEYRVSTLKEAIDVAKENHIILNIELKAKNTEEYKKLAQRVYEIIKENEYESTCLISSLSLGALNYIKNIDKNIKTSLIVIASISNIKVLKNVDYVAMEESLVTRKLVEKCHSRGIGVQIWTLNDSESIVKALKNGVDNIITDEPEIARNEINKFENTPIFGSKIMRLLLDG